MARTARNTSTTGTAGYLALEGGAYAALVVLGSLAVLTVQHWTSFWSRPVLDELHFFATIQRFHAEFGWQTLRHYAEASPPLPFMLYALWGHLVGPEIETLRWLSVGIAAATYHQVFRALRDIAVPPKGAALLLLVLGSNPYMLGLNVLVYTDMLLLLFEVAAFRALVGRRPGWLLVFQAGAFLTRQFHVAFWIGTVLYLLSLLWRDRDREAKALLAATLASILPLLGLFLFWGDVAPASPLRAQVAGHAFSFHWPFLHLYGALAFFYLVPVYPFAVRSLYRETGLPRWGWLAIALLAAGYWLAPVAPNAFYAEQGIPQVGRLHWALMMAGLERTGQQAVFFGGYLLALPMLLMMALQSWRQLARRRQGPALLLDLSVGAFFCVMPFSYLAWEKYFLPVLVLLLLRCGWLWRQPSAAA